jgi:hypothetical protein
MLFSTFLLKEELGKSDVAATVTIFFGTVLSVMFANHSEKDYDVATLKALWFEPRMKIYCIIVPALILLHFAAFKGIECAGEGPSVLLCCVL